MTDLKEIARHALAYPESVEQSYDLARIMIERDIPGDFVECGVYAGAHVAAMAYALMDTGSTRTVHLFDSFMGLPAATPQDEEIWAHHGAKTGESACSFEQVIANLSKWGVPDEFLVYHPGWFEDTVPGFAGAIALLRLDGDLYSSTSVCMKHLYPLLSRGAYCIVDDWNLTGTRKAVNEIVCPAPIAWRTPTK